MDIHGDSDLVLIIKIKNLWFRLLYAIVSVGLNLIFLPKLGFIGLRLSQCWQKLWYGDSTLLHKLILQEVPIIGSMMKVCSLGPHVWSLATRSSPLSIFHRLWVWFSMLDVAQSSHETLVFALQGGGCERVETTICRNVHRQDSSIRAGRVPMTNNGNYEREAEKGR